MINSSSEAILHPGHTSHTSHLKGTTWGRTVRQMKPLLFAYDLRPIRWATPPCSCPDPEAEAKPSRWIWYWYRYSQDFNHIFKPFKVVFPSSRLDFQRPEFPEAVVEQVFFPHGSCGGSWCSGQSATIYSWGDHLKDLYCNGTWSWNLKDGAPGLKHAKQNTVHAKTI